MKRRLSTREKVLLVGLGVAAVVLYRGWRSEGIGLAGSRSADQDPRQQFGVAPIVRMDLLAQTAADFDPPGRDLFQYYTPPRDVKPPPPKPKAEPEPTKRKPRPRPKPPPVRPPRDTAPVPKFRYLGFLGPKDGRIAVFEGSKELMLARVGDTVDEKFKLVEFKYEMVVMGYVDEQYSGRTTELKMSPR